MNGIVIGRFMPPHHGHLFLVDFASKLVDSLTVLVCTLAHEPIPGELRFAWMRELCPNSQILHITEEIPEAQRGQPRAAAIWAEAVKRYVPDHVDRVFASEPYGWDLAAELGAEFVPVDPSRSNIPVSASAIREDPMKEWRFIPPPVRPYYVRHVAVAGTPAFADALGARLKTPVVHDYGAFLAAFAVPSGGAGFSERVVESGRSATIYALARQANRLLIHSVDAIAEDATWDFVVPPEACNMSRVNETASALCCRLGIPEIDNRFTEA